MARVSNTQSPRLSVQWINAAKAAHFHVSLTSFVNVCDVKSAEKPYACLKIVNNKTKMNKTCVLSHQCLGSLVVRKDSG